RQQLKRANHDLYMHIWEGKLRTVAGLLFKRVWFKRYNPGDEPADMSYYLATDYATTDVEDPEVKTEPDFTELGVWGIDRERELWAVDWWSGQVEPGGKDGWIEAMVALCRKWQVERIFEEKGPIYRATRQAVSKSLREKGCMAVRTPIASVNSKVERAMGFVALASDLIVHIPHNEWGNRLVEQRCAFTGQKGTGDDKCAAGGVVHGRPDRHRQRQQQGRARDGFRRPGVRPDRPHPQQRVGEPPGRAAVLIHRPEGQGRRHGRRLLHPGPRHRADG